MFSNFAEKIKGVTPWFIRNFSRKVKRNIQQQRDAKLTCKEVFTQIYNTNAWGGKPSEIYSGPGSSEEASTPYSEAVLDFIRNHDIRSVVDLGCGDFRVGSKIASGNIDYSGVDIVESVIERNQHLYGGAHVRFSVKDIIEDELPSGKLCLIREVFQHLSNNQIQRVLMKLQHYKYIIITDHQPPPGMVIPNLDKPHGGYTRLYDKSALILNKPPFNVKNVELFLDIKAANYLFDQDERIRSFLITNRHH